MRYAILADIHGNLVAFQAVLAAMEAEGGFDEIWCLGDGVGYGPEPHDCIELLRNYKHVCVAGNHDWAAIGEIDISDFNTDAARACRWTGQQLSSRDIKYLRSLPETLVLGDFTLVHGSPRYPVWEYLLSINDARDNFKHFNTRFCLVGHSHIPLMFGQNKAGDYFGGGIPDEVDLTSQGNRLIINPGGVGQPRDGDPRASQIIYDSDAQMMYHYRVHYDVSLTKKKMTEYKLPSSLIRRLSYGY